MNARTILLVEDELLIRTIMADVLRDAGYEATEAANGEDGLEILSDREFDLLITDVRMPGSVDGLQLAANWRKRFPNRPVLLSSAHVGAEQATLCDGLVRKPFSDAELIQAVERVVGLPAQDRAPAIFS
jgi:CheY-like chemotaxis protein